MNSWNISGEILSLGVKGKQYPKLWIKTRLSAPKGVQIDNTLFLNFDIPNQSVKYSDYIQTQYQSKPFFILIDSTIAPITKNKLNANKEWEKETVIGVKGKLHSLHISDKRFEQINVGLVKGKVSEFGYFMESNHCKYIVEERYRNVATNQWASRKVPLLSLGQPEFGDPTGKEVFCTAELCGVIPPNTQRVYGLIKTMTVL